MRKAIFFLFFSFMVVCVDAQIYVGAQFFGADSAPAPNAGGIAFLGYEREGYKLFWKFQGAYIRSFVPDKSQPRTQFNGFLAKVSPEFILTDDRTNPFRANLGLAFYAGKMYEKRDLITPGASVGIVWGIEPRNGRLYEITADVYTLYAKSKQGAASGPLHLIASLGGLMKF